MLEEVKKIEILTKYNLWKCSILNPLMPRKYSHCTNLNPNVLLNYFLYNFETYVKN